MPDYMLAYHGGKTPETPEEGERAMAAWGAWYEMLGDRVVNPGNPVGKSWTVDAKGAREGGGADPLSGYTILRAASIEEACALAAQNPMVVDGSGSAEVAEIIEM